MSQQRKNKKQCVLTTTGKNRLYNKLKTLYPNGEYTNTTLADISDVHRETIAKILNNPSKPVTLSSIEKLFKSLDIELNQDESDYENPPQNEPRNNHQEQSEVSTISNYGINELKTALHELNYDSQKYLFKTAITTINPSGSFLIYGKDNYGQKWLVNLLRYQYLPLHPTTNVWEYRLDFHNKTDFKTLCNRVSSLVFPKNDQQGEITSDMLIEEFFKRWENAPVILVIYIKNIIDTALKDFICQVWQPLVKKVNDQKTPNNNKRLVLFLVSDITSKKKLEKHSLLLVKPSQEDAYKALNLGEIEDFNADLIKNWFHCQPHSKLFSQLYRGEENIEEIINSIAYNSVQPENIFTKICTACGFQWHDIETKLTL